MNSYVDYLNDIGCIKIQLNHFRPKNDGDDRYTGLMQRKSLKEYILIIELLDFFRTHTFGHLSTGN